MKTISALLLVSFCCYFLNGQVTTFQKTYNLPAVGSSVDQTSDGGFIVAGLEGSLGFFGISLLKTNSAGDSIWSRRFTKNTSKAVVYETTGGYIIGGLDSTNGLFLLKTNAQGDSLWQQYYGGTISGLLSSRHLIQTSDGGYAMVGSNSGDVYLVKINASGTTQWTKTIGESNTSEIATSIKQTPDDGYIICGINDGGDIYLLKTNVTGDSLWSKTLTSNGTSAGFCIDLCTDGGFIIGGYTNWSTPDVYIIKTNSAGSIQWTKTFPYGIAHDIHQTTDGGYVFCSLWAAGLTVGLIKTDSIGNLIWQKPYSVRNALQTTDGGFVATGTYGTLLLVKTNSLGCQVSAQTVTTTPSSPFCTSNIPIRLEIDDIGTDYLWSNGDTTYYTDILQSGPYNAQFMDNMNCVQHSDTVSISIFPNPIVILNHGNVALCDGQTVLLDPGAYAAYEWSNGSITRTINVTFSDDYFVSATDNNGCSSVSDTASIGFIFPYAGEQICIVTVDSTTQKNLVVWQKTPNVGTESFNLYKQNNQTSNYDLIATLPFSAFSSYLDTASNPLQISARYKIAVVDTCGNESALSSEHQTIHLSSNVGVNHEVNLSWNAYEGFNYTNFKIYRGTSPSNLSLIGTAPNNTFSFTDQNPPSGTVYYRIEVINPNGCTPSGKRSDYSSSKSNLVDNLPTSVDLIKQNGLRIFPNPFTDYTTIEFPSGIGNGDYRVKIFDFTGRVVSVYENKTEMTVKISRGQLVSGLYLLQVDFNGQIFTGKLNIE